MASVSWVFRKRGLISHLQNNQEMKLGSNHPGTFRHGMRLALLCEATRGLISAMAGLLVTPVLVFWTGLPLHWESLCLWTGFELSSSWSALPCYGANRNRNILGFMR
jgi:hypothetical protein